MIFTYLKVKKSQSAPKDSLLYRYERIIVCILVFGSSSVQDKLRNLSCFSTASSSGDNGHLIRFNDVDDLLLAFVNLEICWIASTSIEVKMLGQVVPSRSGQVFGSFIGNASGIFDSILA